MNLIPGVLARVERWLAGDDPVAGTDAVRDLVAYCRQLEVATSRAPTMKPTSDDCEAMRAALTAFDKEPSVYSGWAHVTWEQVRSLLSALDEAALTNAKLRLIITTNRDEAAAKLDEAKAAEGVRILDLLERIEKAEARATTAEASYQEAQVRIAGLETERDHYRTVLGYHRKMEGEAHTTPCTYGALCPWCEVARLNALWEAEHATVLRMGRERDEAREERDHCQDAIDINDETIKMMKAQRDEAREQLAAMTAKRDALFEEAPAKGRELAEAREETARLKATPHADLWAEERAGRERAEQQVRDLLAYLHATTDEDGTHHRDWVADCQAGDEEVATLKAQVTLWEDSYGKLRADYTSASLDDVERMMDSEMALRAEVERLKAAEHCWPDTAQVKALKAELATVEMAHNAAREEIGQARKTAEYWKAEHRAANEEIVRLNSLWDAEHATVLRKTSEITQLKIQLAETHDGICENGHEQHEDCTDACSCVGSGKSHLERANVRIEELMEENERLRSHMAHLMDVNAGHVKTIAKWAHDPALQLEREAHAETRVEVERLRADLGALQAQNLRGAELVTQMRADLASREEENARLAWEHTQVHEQNDRLVAEHYRLRADLAAYRGTWPNGVHRAFVAGAAWWQWQFKANGTTMFPSERDKVEAEAVRRYGPVSGDKTAIAEVQWPGPGKQVRTDGMDVEAAPALFTAADLAAREEAAIRWAVERFAGITNLDQFAAQVVAEWRAREGR